MQLAKSHKFFLKISGQAEVQVYPVNDTLEFEWIKEEGEIFRRVLNTTLIFENTPEHNTFNELFYLDRTLAPCVDTEIRIEETCKCSEGQETILNWYGLIPFKKGVWDAYACKLEVKPIPNDAIKCLIDKWNIEKDILSILNRVEVKSILGDLEYKFSATKPDGYGWTVNQIFYSLTLDDLEEGSYSSTRWVRQKSSTAFDGWQFDAETGFYYNFAPVAEYKDSFEWNQEPDPSPSDIIGSRIRTYKLIKLEISNCVTLSDVLNLYLGGCGITIVSNFFGINPDLIAPDNTAYRFASNHLQNLLLCHASDVINADASQDATKLLVKWSTIWNDLKVLFNLKMFYDEANTTLYIEHVSFQNSEKKLNIKTNKQIKGFATYKYLDEQFPKIETFKFAYDTNNEDFDNAKIEYSVNCSFQDNKNNEIEYKCEQVVTNIARLYNNDSLAEDDDKLFKTCLLSTDGQSVNSLSGIFNALNLNGALAFTQLVQNLYIYERPLLYGKVNGVEMKFDSVKKQRIQDLNLTLDCKTLIDIKPSYAIETIVGLGEIDKLSISKPSNNINLTLNI